jgi:hypothetical protein
MSGPTQKIPSGPPLPCGCNLGTEPSKIKISERKNGSIESKDKNFLVVLHQKLGRKLKYS